MQGLFAETYMYSTGSDVIKPTRKLLSIDRLNCMNFHLINVFRV